MYPVNKKSEKRKTILINSNDGLKALNQSLIKMVKSAEEKKKARAATQEKYRKSQSKKAKAQSNKAYRDSRSSD